MLNLAEGFHVDLHDRTGLLVDLHRGRVVWVREPALGALLRGLLGAHPSSLESWRELAIAPDDSDQRYLEVTLGPDRTLVIDDPEWVRVDLRRASADDDTLLNAMVARRLLRRSCSPTPTLTWLVRGCTWTPSLRKEPCPGMAELLAGTQQHVSRELLVFGDLAKPPTAASANAEKAAITAARQGVRRLLTPLVGWQLVRRHLLTDRQGPWSALDTDAAYRHAVRLIAPVRQALTTLTPLIRLRRRSGAFTETCLLDSVALTCAYRSLGLGCSLILGRALAYTTPGEVHKLHAWVEVCDRVVNGPENLRGDYRPIATL